jgi:putative heme iron utilization protein
MPKTSETILDFLSERRSAVLSTLDENGLPHTSYAPFLWHDNRCYIYISEAARHTGNLLERPECSLLFIEDEGSAGQIFARKRVMLSCRADELPRRTPSYADIMGRMEERFGGIIATLGSMQDFHLFALTPRSGEAVFGFGEAYLIESPFEKVVPKRSGHSRRQE